MKKKTSKTTVKRPASRAGRAGPRAQVRKKPAARAGERAPIEAALVEAALLPVPVVEAAADTAILVESPEPLFASRVLPPEPERPFPTGRRAIFYDVENASRPEHISRVIEHLGMDRAGRRTDFVAVGNWRVIGHDTARLLARHGAHLVHSAPSVGVRDWSDLRIAVAAGVWLAGARPGDALEIVTNDRAFDAVGDVAASLGIAFQRLSHQGVGGGAVEPPRAPAREVTVDPRARRRGRGRHRGGWRERVAPSPAVPAPAPERPVEPVALAPVPVPVAEVPTDASPHTAPHDEIIAVVHDLMQRSTKRSVTLDTLANALKSRGFSRPAGSPRLITRIRRIKEIALSRSGVITLVGDRPVSPLVEEPEEAVAAVEPEAEAAEAVEVADLDEVDEGPGPGNEAVPGEARVPEAQASRRRRSRRGGRGRHRRPQTAPAA